MCLKRIEDATGRIPLVSSWIPSFALFAPFARSRNSEPKLACSINPLFGSAPLRYSQPRHHAIRGFHGSTDLPPHCSTNPKIAHSFPKIVATPTPTCTCAPENNIICSFMIVQLKYIAYNPPTAFARGRKLRSRTSLFLNSVEFLLPIWHRITNCATGGDSACFVSFEVFVFPSLSPSIRVIRGFSKPAYPSWRIFSPHTNHLYFLPATALTARNAELFTTLPGVWPKWRIIPSQIEVLDRCKLFCYKAFEISVTVVACRIIHHAAHFAGEKIDRRSILDTQIDLVRISP